MNEDATVYLFYQHWQTVQRHLGAILLWIYLLVMMAFAYHWVEN